MTYYPNCEKLESNCFERQAILDFVEWLAKDARGIYDTVLRGVLAHPRTNRLVPTRSDIDDLIMQWLGIDQKEMEKENRARLNENSKPKDNVDMVVKREEDDSDEPPPPMGSPESQDYGQQI